MYCTLYWSIQLNDSRDSKLTVPYSLVLFEYEVMIQR